MKVKIDYPDAISEKNILRLVRSEAGPAEDFQREPFLSQAEIFKAKEEVLALHMAEVVEDYIVALTMATRNTSAYGDGIEEAIDYGVSPRGTIALDLCSRANAYLHGKDFVSPGDVQAVVHDVFRHRLILRFETEARGISTDEIIDLLVQKVAVA